MKKHWLQRILFSSIVLFFHFNIAIAEGCKISVPKWVTNAPTDTLSILLTQSQNCPSNVTDFKELLFSKGYTSSSYIVANRGHHNPTQGSFSFFETIEGHGLRAGDFTFGHFSRGTSTGVLSLDQNPTLGALMIELIVFDSTLQVFNFYEMIGNGKLGDWHYRGNSMDITDDKQNLFVSRNNGTPAFDSKLRCSGCHIAGGPILKEMNEPHNDWWRTSRKLPLGNWKLDNETKQIFAEAKDASEFAYAIKTANNRLIESKAFQNHLSSKSLQSQLRPLFCDEDLELVSDVFPLDGPLLTIQIPAKSIVNPIFGSADINISKDNYLEILKELGSQFPETTRLDADHAWLVPAKGGMDFTAINTLKSQGLIDDEFVHDVLAVDYQNPFLSNQRCPLLKHLPQSKTPNWRDEFTKNLMASSSPAAKELLKHLTDESFTAESHILNVSSYLSELQESMALKSDLKSYMTKHLFSKRDSVFRSELSSNPRGQILEPGFRVIFPQIKN